MIVEDFYSNREPRVYKEYAPTLRSDREGLKVVQQEVKQIGNIVDTGNWDNPQRGRIYSADGCCPSLNTVGGGGLEPKIVEEPKLLGGLGEMKSNNGTQYFQQDRVYSSDGVAMCHPANIPGGSYKYCMEEIKVLGNYHDSNHDASRVVDTNGVAPTVKENHGTVTGILYPTIVASRGGNPQNPSDRTPGIHTEKRLEMNKDGVSNTLTSVNKDNLVLQQDILAIDEQNMNVRKETFGTITTDGSSPKHNNRVLTQHYRIRKLTPRECGRLMGVSDEDITKMLEVNSNSQCYKQFGNSIVVDVMEAMFRNLNIKEVSNE